MAAGPDVEIEPYRRPHLPGIIAIFRQEGYVNYLDEERAHRVLSAPGATTLVAVDEEGEVVGIVEVQGDGAIQGHVSIFAVAATSRRRRIGSRLLATAIKRSGCMRVDLLSNDATSDAFYRSFPHREGTGFRIYPAD